MNVAREGREASGPHRDDVMNPENGDLGPEEIWKERTDRLLIRLATTPAGLDSAEVRSRLTTYGPNDAATVKRSPLWLQFLARFRNPIARTPSAMSAHTYRIQCVCMYIL